MGMKFEKYFGINPGAVLERELKRRLINRVLFAASISETLQVVNAIIRGRKRISPKLSLKMDRALGIEDGSFYLLQAHYDIRQAAIGLSQDNAPVFRKVLFWDTDVTKIDWTGQYKAVIRRVFERGNDEEKQEALNFYGKDKIKEVSGSEQAAGNSLPVMAHLNKDNMN